MADGEPQFPEVAAAARGRPGFLSAQPWAIVGLLALVYALNNIDRHLPTILAEPMKRELHLTDTFLGFINGAGFLVVYAVAGIPIARLADRGRGGPVIASALGGWSLMTMLGGLVVFPWQLAITRMGVAVGEAGSTPAGHAYISRNFRPEQRAAAISVMSLGAPIGTMAALMGGGLLGQLLGWRIALLAVGLAGLMAAPLVLFAIGWGRVAPAAHAGSRSTAISVLLRKRSAIALCAGSALIAFGGYASSAFAPAFLMRVHGMSIASVGVQLGLVYGVTGMSGMLLMGWLSGRLSKRDARWPLFLLLILSLVSIPLGVTAYLFAPAEAAVLCIALGNLAATSYLGVVVANLHAVTPAALRAQASAVLLFITAVVGGFGPVAAGALSDHLTASFGRAALGPALMITPASYALAAIAFAIAATTFRRDLVERA
jgi:predicted MFS family arabinose efflux permease